MWRGYSPHNPSTGGAQVENVVQKEVHVIEYSICSTDLAIGWHCSSLQISYPGVTVATYRMYTPKFGADK